MRFGFDFPVVLHVTGKRILQLLGDLAHADAGRAEAATVALREAVRLAPADVPSRLKLAEILVDRGDTEDSRAFYVAVIADRPGSAIAHYGLGRALGARAKWRQPSRATAGR